MGKKLVLTSGDFLSPVVLSNSEDVSCGLLASHLAAAGCTSGRVLLWSLHPRHLDTVGECRVLGGGEAGVQLQLLGDSLYILTRSGRVTVLNLVFGNIVKQVQSAEIIIMTITMLCQISAPASCRLVTMAVCPGLLAAATPSKAALVWSLAEGRVATTLQLRHVAACLQLARPLLVTGGGETVQVWQLRTAQLLHTLDTRGAQLSCLGTWRGVLVAGDVRGHVITWDLETRGRGTEAAEPRVLAQLADAVRGLHLTDDSLTALSFDAHCLIWDFW